MYKRTYPITPSQPATNGALDVFVEGFQKNDVPQMLWGLSVLSSATEAQVHAAMLVVETTRHTTPAEITAMLAQ